MQAGAAANVRKEHKYRRLTDPKTCRLGHCQKVVSGFRPEPLLLLDQPIVRLREGKASDDCLSPSERLIALS